MRMFWEIECTSSEPPQDSFPLFRKVFSYHKTHHSSMEGLHMVDSPSHIPHVHGVHYE